MVENDDLRHTKLALSKGSGAIPALGFGTLIPDPVATKTATKAALDAGFRQLDASERYRNESEVGEAMREVFTAGTVKREDVFIATELWNNNHRPERVKPAFEAGLEGLRLDYVDLYLIHTPFAFQPGDEQDPRDAGGDVIYDEGVTLLDTWRALERLVDEGGARPSCCPTSAWNKRARSSKPGGSSRPWFTSSPIRTSRNGTSWTIASGTASCCKHLRRWGHSSEPKLLGDPLIITIAERVNKTPAQVLLAWAIRRGTALLTTSTTPSRIKENFEVSALPDDAMREISEGIKTRVRFNPVVETGIPGFIPRGNGVR